MKSPTSSVGIIEPEGIRNGSATNERSSNTTSTTGNSERAQSTGTGSVLLAGRIQARLALLVEEQPIQAPYHAEKHGKAKQNRREIKFHVLLPKSGNRKQGTGNKCKAARAALSIPCSSVARSRYLSTLRTARKASCGISTRPTCFMRFLPSFCFSSNFFLRLTSPP